MFCIFYVCGSMFCPIWSTNWFDPATVGPWLALTLGPPAYIERYVNLMWWSISVHQYDVIRYLMWWRVKMTLHGDMMFWCDDVRWHDGKRYADMMRYIKWWDLRWRGNVIYDFVIWYDGMMYCDDTMLMLESWGNDNIYIYTYWDIYMVLFP